MPPGYKPLGVSLQGIAPEIFGTRPISWMDARASAETLQNQDLSNANNEILVKRRQQEFEQEQALRDALVSQYGGGGFDSFNPEEALMTAQRIALENGDLDTALKVERAKEERRVREEPPLSQQQRDFFGSQIGSPLPEGFTMKDLNMLSTLGRTQTYKESTENTQNRFQKDRESWLPPGYVGNITKKDGEEFKQTLQATGEAREILRELKDSVLQTGNNQVTGREAVRQRSLVSQLLFKLKGPGFENLGTALTATELPRLLDQLPLLLSSSDAGVGRILVELGFGRDPIDAIDVLEERLDRMVRIQKQVKGIKGPEDFANERKTKLSGGSLPRNPDGTPLSREQFQQMFGRSQ